MIKTFGIKYIGSKNKLNDYIIQLLGEKNILKKENLTAIDIFAGTTRVAQALRQYNIKTYTSDLSWASEAYAYTFVHNYNNLHLQELINDLNNIKGYSGWITQNYCDVISNGNKVRVWQPKNGMKADAIRDHIETLNLEHWEKMTLITSLLFALDSVDNTVGVQQAYLKDWCIRSYKDLILNLPPMINVSGEELPIGEHFVGDALKIAYPPVTLAYLDPPYSPHSYATYYHIWDSIVRWDKPSVSLKTNRRVDRVSKHKDYDSSLESPWNRKNQALNAFSTLIDRLDVEFVLISYNNESLVPMNDLIDLCFTKGETDIEFIDYNRNIMSQIGNQKKSGKEPITKNQELLILIKKN